MSTKMTGVSLCWVLLWLAALGLLTLPARSRAAPKPAAAPRQSSGPLPFLVGADLSELPVHEQQGVHYFDDGSNSPQDLLAIARHNHWNVVRVRLWVDPAPAPDAQVSGLPAVTTLGRRIKAAGLKFLLDIHYSDTWADPGHQRKPAAWAALPFPQLVQKVHDYTRAVIIHLAQNNALPDLVQVGNETRSGLLYGTDNLPGGGFWEHDKHGIDRAVRLLAAGLDGVRDGAAPQAAPVTLLHIPDGQDAGFVRWYFTQLQSHAAALRPPVALRFDWVGLSYYPAHPWSAKEGFEPWHISHLIESMNFVAQTLHKPVLVVETNWPHAGAPSAALPGTPEFAFTPSGQAAFVRALTAAVQAVPDHLGKGFVLWDMDTLNWDSVFDDKGHALLAARALGQP